MSDSGPQIEALRPQVRVLLVTVIPAEREALLRRLAPLPGEAARRTLPFGCLTYDVGLIGVFGCAHCTVGKGVAGALADLKDAVRAWHPDLLVMVGVAAGKEGLPLGAALISSSVLYHEPGEIKEGRRLERFGLDEASRLLVDRLTVSAERQGLPHKVGCLVSGELKIDDPAEKERLFSLRHDAVGIEMEAAAVYKAAEGLRWCVVKAVCDFGTMVHRGFQAEAADNAARVVEGAFTDPLAFSGDPYLAGVRRFGECPDRRGAATAPSERPQLVREGSVQLNPETRDVQRHFAGKDWLPRPALGEALVELVLGHRVTVLVAPTGYGKTHLVWSELPHFGRERCLWIDCARLVQQPPESVLLAAARSFDPGLDESSLEDFLLERFEGLIVLDGLECCMGQAENPQTPVGRSDHWISLTPEAETRLSGHCAWLEQLLVDFTHSRHAAGRVLVTSQARFPLADRPPAMLDLSGQRLTPTEALELLRGWDEGGVLPLEPHQEGHAYLLDIVEECDGIPAALEIIHSWLSVALQETEMQDGFLRLRSRQLRDRLRPGVAGKPLTPEQRLRHFIEAFLQQFTRSAQRQALLRALALLGVPFRLGKARPDDEEPGLSTLAAALCPRPASDAALRRELDRLLSRQCVVRHAAPGLEPQYHLPRLLARVVLDDLAQRPAGEQLQAVDALMQLLGNVLESFPTESGKERLTSLTAFYALETEREQELVSRWLWAMFRRHQLVHMLEPEEIAVRPGETSEAGRARAGRAAAHAVLVSLSAVAANLHFWWTLFAPLPAYGRILDRADVAVEIARDAAAAGDADLLEELEEFLDDTSEVIHHWRELERHYPRGEAWNLPVRPEACARVLKSIAALRRLLDRYQEPAESVYGACAVDEQNVTALLHHFEGEVLLAQGCHEPSLEAQQRAWDGFTPKLEWAKPYVACSQARSKWALGRHAAARERLRVALDLAGDDSEPDEENDFEPKAWAWIALADCLADQGEWALAARSARRAALYAFKQLPNPAYGGPLYRVDEYNRRLYRQMLDRLVLCVRRWEAAVPGAGAGFLRETADWMETLRARFAPEEVRALWDEARDVAAPDGYVPGEERLLVEPEAPMRAAYEALARTARLPRVADLDSGGARGERTYAELNAAVWNSVKPDLMRECAQDWNLVAALPWTDAPNG